MMRNRILSLIIMLTILSSFSAFPSQCEEEEVHFRVLKVYWGDGQPVEVSPGETSQLTVILRYEMSKSLNNLKAALSLPEGFEAIGGGNESVVVYTKTIVKGSILELRFPLFIGSNVTLGSYTANLTLEYFISECTILNSTVTVEFEVTGKPALAIRALNDSLRQGEQRVLLLLLNEGDASMHGFRITRIHSSTISIELARYELIGELKPGENLTLPVRLFVPPGLSGKIASLTVEGSYLGPTNVVYSFSKSIQLPVKPSNPAPLRLSITPGELTIGRRSRIRIRLENTGGHSLSEIEMSLSPEGALKIFGLTSFYIEKLPPGESRLIETEVYVPLVASQTASLKVAVTYLDDDLWISRSETHHLSVLLRGFIDISLTDTAVIPSAPTPGSPFSITITITNIGTSTAYAAYAIPDLRGLPLRSFGPRSVYVGNIETNLPTTITINLQLENTTQRRIVLPVIIRYLDNLRTPHNVTFNIPINVAPLIKSEIHASKPRKTGMSIQDPLLLGIIAILIAAAVVIVIALKRWR